MTAGMRRQLKPLFVKDKELIYDYDEDNVFNGGNNWRLILKAYDFKAKNS